MKLTDLAQIHEPDDAHHVAAAVMRIGAHIDDFGRRRHLDRSEREEIGRALLRVIEEIAPDIVEQDVVISVQGAKARLVESR